MSTSYPNFSFTVTAQDGLARSGDLHTPHGSLETPAFIFCATKAATRVATPQVLRQENTQIILANTYHLMLRPGAELVEKMGGLHKFTGWDGPMLTDSGGFQVFSMGHGLVADEIKGKRLNKGKKSLLTITEEGAAFRSYVDGTKQMLTPERSIDVQRRLGADIILVFDECAAFHVTKEYTAQAMHRSHRWAVRSLQEFNRKHDGRQSLYGIIQGGTYEDLRKESAAFACEQDYFGHAIGGSMGDTKELMDDIVSWSMSALRNTPNRPIHLLGIGGLRDIWEGVARGIDTFDCVNPTRFARHNSALTAFHPTERRNMKNARYREDPAPLEPGCACQTCATVSRAYIYHLVQNGEPLGYTLLSTHNIHFMNAMMARIRAAIASGRFEQEKAAFLSGLDTEK